MLKIIEELAFNIEQKWKKVDYSCYDFSAIVLKEIGNFELVENFNFFKLNDFLDICNIKNIQIASEFSELHLKLFDNGRFYIEVLNWWDKDTSIHDHGFSGVLIQLQGSALNAIYSFLEEKTVSQHLRLGQVKLIGAEVSNKGSIRNIPYGRQERHAVLHLEQPTISLIIRTHPVADISPQLNYFPPETLVNHSAIDIAFNKRIKYFQLLHEIDGKEFKKQLLKTMLSSSHTDNFWLLMKLSGYIFKPENTELIRIYIDESESPEEKEIREKLVTSTASRKASQFIIDQVKPHFQTKEQRLFLAACAASYSNKEREFMFEKLGIVYNEYEISKIKDNLPKFKIAEFLWALRILSP